MRVALVTADSDKFGLLNEPGIFNSAGDVPVTRALVADSWKSTTAGEELRAGNCRKIFFNAAVVALPAIM
jgi:hypothetical protein